MFCDIKAITMEGMDIFYIRLMTMTMTIAMILMTRMPIIWGRCQVLLLRRLGLARGPIQKREVLWHQRRWEEGEVILLDEDDDGGGGDLGRLFLTLRRVCAWMMMVVEVAYLIELIKTQTVVEKGLCLDVVVCGVFYWTFQNSDCGWEGLAPGCYCWWRFYRTQFRS